MVTRIESVCSLLPVCGCKPEKKERKEGQMEKERGRKVSSVERVMPDDQSGGKLF